MPLGRWLMCGPGLRPGHLAEPMTRRKVQPIPPFLSRINIILSPITLRYLAV